MDGNVSHFRELVRALVAEVLASRKAWPKTNGPFVASAADVEALAIARAHTDSFPELAEALGVIPLEEPQP